MDNVASELSIECDYIENVGGTGIYCIEIFNANKFHLSCNRVFSQRGVAIWLGSYNTSSHTLEGFVENVNLNVFKVETGVTGFGSTAFISLCNGFIKIDEISALYNRGHCFSHRAGEVIARIKKMTTVMISSAGGISTVHTSQGTGEQKLVLYFDEIINKFGSSTVNSSLCIEHHQGTGIFIGRRIISISNNVPNSTPAIQISKEVTTNDLPKGYLKINEIISTGGVAMIINDFTDQITIDSNSIEGNGSGDGGVIFVFGASTFIIKNATIKNTHTGSSVKGMGLFEEVSKGTTPNVTLNKVKIISNGSIIFYNSTPAINISNFGLFGTVIPDTNVNLKIGPKPGEMGYNYQCIIDPDLN